MKVKRFLLALTLLCLLVCALAVGAYARDPGTSGQIGANVFYTLSPEGVLTISGTGDTYSYNPTYNDFSPFWGADIKSVVIELGVTGIGDNLFNNCPDITSVSIAPGVTFIGEQAFCSCEGLTQVKLPATVTRIEKNAFYGCSNLTSINCPKSVTSIEKAAFYGCDSLMEIPGVEQDGAIRWTLNKQTGEMHFTGSGNMPNFDVVNNRYATWNYLTDHIRSVIIDEGITSIGSFDFWDCDRLVSVSIPDTVTDIGASAFSCCTSLPQLQLPDGITRIAAETFASCYSLTSLTIPESVTQIGQYAFVYSGLTEITIPDSVTSMRESVFEDCKSLVSAVLSKGIDTLPSNTFKGCVSLSQVEIRSQSLYQVGSHAFEGCISLEAISLPENTEGIQSDCFKDCANLRDIRLPGELTYIANSAFENCTSLTSVTIGPKVFWIGDDAFLNCTGLTEVNLAEGLEQLDGSAFQGCTGLTSIRIPDTVTYLGQSTFQDCTNLEAVELSKNITMIGKSCFLNCASLSELEIPDVLTYIDDFAFYGCDALESVTIHTPECDLGTACFPENITVYGYEGSTAQEYAEIYELEFISLGQPGIDRYTIEVENNKYYYIGKEVRPSVSVQGLIQGKDYTVSYENNINAGRATVVVTGMGNIPGTVRAEFTILPSSLPTVRFLDSSSYEYTGQIIIPSLRVYNSGLECELTEGVDYTLTSTGKDPGYGWVTVTGMGNYTGTEQLRFTVTQGKLSNNSFTLEQTRYNYTGQAIEPKVIAPEHLVEGVDYAVTYYSNTALGTGSIRLSGMGNWTGYVEMTFEIVKGLEAPQVTGANLSPSGKIKLTWAGVEGAQSYRIYRSTVENGTYIPVGTAPGTGFVDLKAKPGIRYFYKVVAQNQEGSSDASNIVSRVARLSRTYVTVKRNNGGRPVIRWNTVEGAVKYQVYRCTSQNGRYTLLKTVPGTGYVDTTARPGVTYYYKVVAVGRSSDAKSNPSDCAVLPKSLTLPLYR